MVQFLEVNRKLPGKINGSRKVEWKAGLMQQKKTWNRLLKNVWTKAIYNRWWDAIRTFVKNANICVFYVCEVYSLRILSQEMILIKLYPSIFIDGYIKSFTHYVQ